MADADKWDYCPKCGVAWDAWGPDATKCWSCGNVKPMLAISPPMPQEAPTERCADHPHYAAKAEPKNDRRVCWLMYRETIDKKIEEIGG